MQTGSKPGCYRSAAHLEVYSPPQGGALAILLGYSHRSSRMHLNALLVGSSDHVALLLLMLRFYLKIMSKQQGTPCRASLGRGKSQRGCILQVTEGYENHISPPVRILAEDWEGRVLN